MDGEHQITEITQHAIADHFDLHRVDWAGSFSQAEFLARLYDLETMPSRDHRFKTASGDIWQHTSNNEDWNPSWPFTDRRFHLMHVPDDEFLRFLAETLRPLVRPSAENARELAAAYNELLQHDGWQLVENRLISGRPVYGARSTTRAVVFQEPTGWARVDRQVQDAHAPGGGGQRGAVPDRRPDLPRSADLGRAGGFRSRAAPSLRRHRA